jgi:pyridoxamine 5'-phosphate oxidase
MPYHHHLDPSGRAESTRPAPSALAAPTAEPAERALDERDAPASPFELFRRWLEDAHAAAIPQPQATVLATATADGVPSARTLLLERFDPTGFVFHTKLDSPKCQDLDENPRAALVFLWRALGRQVRVTGDVVPASRAETEAYFRGRPHGVQVMLTACAAQSAVVDSRAALEEAYAEALARYPTRLLPIPPSLGGLRVIPETLEFFQARANCLQDRLRYTRAGDAWRLERLVP